MKSGRLFYFWGRGEGGEEDFEKKSLNTPKKGEKFMLDKLYIMHLFLDWKIMPYLSVGKRILALTKFSTPPSAFFRFIWWLIATVSLYSMPITIVFLRFHEGLSPLCSFCWKLTTTVFPRYPEGLPSIPSFVTWRRLLPPLSYLIEHLGLPLVFSSLLLNKTVSLPLLERISFCFTEYLWATKVRTWYTSNWKTDESICLRKGSTVV